MCCERGPSPRGSSRLDPAAPATPRRSSSADRRHGAYVAETTQGRTQVLHEQRPAQLLLVARAQLENLAIVAADPLIERYDVPAVLTT